MYATTTTLLNPHSSHKVTSGPGKPGAGENERKVKGSVRPGAIGGPIVSHLLYRNGLLEEYSGNGREGGGRW